MNLCIHLLTAKSNSMESHMNVPSEGKYQIRQEENEACSFILSFHPIPLYLHFVLVFYLWKYSWSLGTKHVISNVREENSNS